MQRKQEEGRFNLVVLGQFKRGKSTLINALLGEDVLSTGVLPLNSVITRLRYGSKRLRVKFSNGQEKDVDFDLIGRYTTEEGNPSNEKKLEKDIKSSQALASRDLASMNFRIFELERNKKVQEMHIAGLQGENEFLYQENEKLKKELKKVRNG